MGKRGPTLANAISVIFVRYKILEYILIEKSGIFFHLNVLFSNIYFSLFIPNICYFLPKYTYDKLRDGLQRRRVSTFLLLDIKPNVLFIIIYNAETLNSL